MKTFFLKWMKILRKMVANNKKKQSFFKRERKHVKNVN